MSTDPIRDYAEWSGMTPEWESRIAHPAGKRLESAEVAQARMDAEALELANSGQPKRCPEWIAAGLLAVFIYLAIAGISVAAALVEGWPA